MFDELVLATMAFTLIGFGVKTGTAIAAGIATTSSLISAYGTYRQGRANERVANMNADLANKEARQQLMLAKLQGRLAKQQAEAQYRAEMAESQAAYLNAQGVDSERRAMEARSQEEIRRRRDNIDHIVSEKQAMFATSGVVGSTGTALQVMADAVVAEESNAIDQHYLANVERTRLLFEADVERARGGRIGAFAGAQKVINLNAAKVAGLAAQVGARNKMSQADIDRQAGKYLRRQSTISAVAQGIGGVANGASIGAIGVKTSA